MTDGLRSYREILLKKYEDKKVKNRRYSLRAFARDIGLSSSRFSEILNGKIGISLNKAIQIANKLNLDDHEKSLFTDLVEVEHARSKIARNMAKQRLMEKKSSSSAASNSSAHPLTIKNLTESWTCLLVLLNLDLINSSSPDDCCSKLSLSQQDFSLAIETLHTLNIIIKDAGKWTRGSEIDFSSFTRLYIK